MGAAARSTDRFERKREAILDASTEILNQKGVKGLTLGGAAAAVGLSTTSVTYYFPRRDDLAAAVLMRGIDWMHATVLRALAEPTPPARLSRLTQLHFDRVTASARDELPPLPSLADARALGDPQRRAVGDAYMKVFRKARLIFDDPGLAWLSRGRRTARIHMVLEQLFWASGWLRWYEPEDHARLRERLYDILVGGLAPPDAAWAPRPLPMGVLAKGGAEMGRETFLVAATRLINARGYRGASVDKISAALGVTKGSFYHHNEAKDDLVVACFERTFEVTRRVQRLAMDLPADQWTRLTSAAAALAEYQVSDRGPLLRMSALSALPEAIRMAMVAQSTRISDRFAGMISDGIAEGSIRPVDPFIAAQMLNATLNAAAALPTWVPGVTPKAAPSVFVRPLLTGVFER